MIKIAFNDSKTVEIENGLTVYDAIKAYDSELAKIALGALVDGEVTELTRTLDADCAMTVLDFSTDEGKRILRHTASHILAQAVKRLYPETKLAIGPAIDNGFYYDFDREEGFTADDLNKLESEMKKIVKEGASIERFTLPREEAIKLMQEKTYDALAKVYKLYYENKGVYFWENWTGFMDYFPGGTLVFAQGMLDDAFNALRDMEDPFGIVPQPKYDEAQDGYHCLVADGYFIVGMPTTVTDTDFVSLMTEAMAAETYTNVYPVYYDVALKSKYSKDEATAAMIDLISAGAAFDVSFMYGTYLEMLPYMFRGCLNEKTTDIASTYAKAESKIATALGKIYAMYE